MIVNLQVCSKAFARRDKLVIHMNKFKHVTPTNIAPLGKRLNHTMSDIKKKEENNENNKTSLGQSTAMLEASLNVSHIMNSHLQSSHHSVGPSIATLNIPQSHQQLSWSCELCGRMFSTRDEWSLHAKSHLEVRCV